MATDPCVMVIKEAYIVVPFTEKNPVSSFQTLW